MSIAKKVYANADGISYLDILKRAMEYDYCLFNSQDKTLATFKFEDDSYLQFNREYETFAFADFIFNKIIIAKEPNFDNYSVSIVGKDFASGDIIIVPQCGFFYAENEKSLIEQIIFTWGILDIALFDIVGLNKSIN